MQNVQQASGFLSRVLNPATLITAVRRGVGGLDGAVSLFFLVASVLGLFAVLPPYITYDLMSTWNFFQGVQYDTGAQAEVIASFIASATQSVSLGAFIGMMIAWGITLFPTLVELVAPSIQHPGVQLFNQMCVGFDYITDFPLAWAKAGEWTQVWIVRVAVALVFNLIVSLGLQVFVVMFATVAIISLLNIFGFKGRRAQPVQVIEVNPNR